MTVASLADRLLVASPLIGDETFRRTVVHLLAHTEEGAVGVILNRPTATPAAAVADRWGERAAAPSVLFAGGPVEQDCVVGLGIGGAVDLNRDPDELTDAPAEVRLFAGQAGWGADQLEEEVGEQAWWVVEAEPDDLLTRDPDHLWERVLRRQRGATAWFANLPEDLRTG